ncbi:hypothetical protein [Bacillus atrophaeus]|uniref:hypothetical protein n=1 Tax=Bacillus atrophaeus TaxID=1452 RepID=UPI0012394818|nr:hypothetical protein DX926_06035 [Bacillus atrophaeus]
MNKRILLQLGHLQMDKINSMLILDFINKLECDGSRGDDKSGGLSSATIRITIGFCVISLAVQLNGKLSKKSL